MIKVYTHSNSLIVFNISNILKANHIACTVKNDGLLSAAGELPPTDLWPEIWLDNENDRAKALELIESATTGNTASTTWFCFECGEKNEPAFEICWNCGHDPTKGATK